MDSYEWNKIAGAVLFALLVSVGLSIFSDVIFESEAPETPGYIVALATEEGAEAGGQEQAEQPIAALLASADPKMGENSAKKCGACHTFGSGEANKIGPNLYGVVNRPIAAHEGYEYDDAMKAFAETAGTWTFDHLNTFLRDPKGMVPGTKMAFAGLKNNAERANVIAYLRSLSDNPAPLPEPAAAEAPAETVVASADAGAVPAEAPAADPPAEATAAAPAEAPATVEAPATAEAPAAPAEAPAAAAPAEQPSMQAVAPAETQTAQTETPAAEPAPAAAPAAEAGAGDVKKGGTFAKRCTVCHDLTNAAANKVGPHLFGVVGRPVASVPDFGYSDAMKAFSEGGAKVWDDATLDAYLADPRKVVPGTKMVFPGVKAEADRQNVIAYLNTLKE